MSEKKFKIRDSVDIYVFNDENDDSSVVQVQFYKINTREKSTIEIRKEFLDILRLLNGRNTLADIIDRLGISIELDELVSIFNFLQKKGFLEQAHTSSLLTPEESERYSRQINYLDNLVPTQGGDVLQHELLNKKVLIIGVGSVGSTVAAQLLRAGVINLKLMDPKKLRESHVSRHIYADQHNLGQYKVDALTDYLKKINSKCNIEVLSKKLIPTTNLLEVIESDIDIVVNTADEPYIGHTTLKLGRYLWNKGIGLYVSGGFDAHLMSSGELICKGLTPCADCCSQTFQKALTNWKPQYNLPNEAILDKKNILEEGAGGDGFFVASLAAGGIFSQSLYSSSLASMNIIDYLLNNCKGNDKLNKRGEYLINQGKNSWFEMKKQTGCEYCGA